MYLLLHYCSITVLQYLYCYYTVLLFNWILLLIPEYSAEDDDDDDDGVLAACPALWRHNTQHTTAPHHARARTRVPSLSPHVTLMSLTPLGHALTHALTRTCSLDDRARAPPPPPARTPPNPPTHARWWTWSTGSTGSTEPVGGFTPTVELCSRAAVGDVMRTHRVSAGPRSLRVRGSSAPERLWAPEPSALWLTSSSSSSSSSDLLLINTHPPSSSSSSLHHLLHPLAKNKKQHFRSATFQNKSLISLEANYWSIDVLKTLRI